jgi:hypothetical protein
LTNVITLNDIVTKTIQEGHVSLATLMTYKITIGECIGPAAVVVDTFTKSIDLTRFTGNEILVVS